MAPDHPGEMLTTSDVAKQFRVSRTTVIRWFESGELPGIQIGKIRRFRRADVERLLTPKQVAI